MFKKVSYGIAISLILLGLFLCNETSPTSQTNNNPLTGTWNMTRQINKHSYGVVDTISSGLLVKNKYVLGDDFSLSGTSVLIGMSVNLSGIWRVKADSVALKLGESDVQIWHYAVSGNNLTMTRNIPEGSGTEKTEEYYTKE
jgi:hypothetical protein